MRHKMKTFCKRILATACAASMVLGSLLSDLGTISVSAAEEHTLWLVGDSTVCAFNDSYFYPRYGYGTQIANYLDDTYKVQNLAVSGTSSKSFLSNANYQTLLDGIAQGDTLVIGFGHNDEKSDDAARFTDPNGDYTTEGSFANSLYTNYVKMAQDKGADVVLCTPIVRRTSGSWADNNLHVTAAGDYPQAIRDLAEAVNVPLVDLTAKTKELYDSLGTTETLYLHAWTSSKESSVDNTHLNIYGAKKVAWLFANALAETEAPLASHVSLDAGEPTKEADLKSNPDYVEKEYDNNLADSQLFSDYVIGEGETAVHFKGTAFGQLGGNPNTTYHTLETDANGDMHVRVSGNKGKITSTEDGIVMYYYKVPVGSSFSLFAKATVNAYDANQQVAFGLMARDDMYIDTYTGGIASDYVVAGTLGTGCNCFYRRNGALGGKAALEKESLAAGKSYNLSIVSNADGYTCTFGDETPQSAGYDFALTGVDSDYVYIGMFASRNADITYSNICLTVDGETLADTRKTEYAVKLSDDGNGTASANKTSAAAGETVVLTAKAAEGYIFKEWKVLSGEITIEDNSFVMPASEVEIQAIFEELRTEWNFQTDESLYGDNGVKLEGTAATVAGLSVDATAGKWDSTLTNGWVQVNAGTLITIPVAGSSKISLEMYKENYTVDGQVATAAAQTFVCEGEDGKVVLEITANNYLRSILVTPFAYVEEKLHAFSEDVKIPGITTTNITWHDAQHGLLTAADATMVLSLSEKANVTVLSCRYNSASGMTASSGTLKESTVDESGADAPQYTVLEAEAGELTLSFEAGMYLHSVMVEYLHEVGPRKIDVWDFGGKEETDTDSYQNNVTAQKWIDSGVVAKGGKFSVSGTTTFGDVTVSHNSNDRLYSNLPELADYNGGSYAPAQYAFSDGYTAAGVYYCNGTGGTSRRNLTIANVQAGDKIVAYAGIQSGSTDTQFIFEGLGAASSQKDTVEAAAGQFSKYEFVAEYTGTYKLWENAAGKPMYHRLMRFPGVAVSGTIDFGEYTGTGYEINFVNQTTKKATVATVEGNSFTVTLAPGYTYTAVLSGATGYGFTTDTKTVVTTDAEALTGKTEVALKVEPKSTYVFSGKITGFAEGYDTSALKITMVPPVDSNLDEVALEIAQDLSFTAVLEPEVVYTTRLEGVNDYEVQDSKTVESSENLKQDIVVVTRPVYAVEGTFQGLSGAEVTALSFENVEDGYSYQAQLKDGGYQVALRDGAYLAKATVSGYSTSTHVVVNGEAVHKDLLFVSTSGEESLPLVGDLYVGYPEQTNNYSTVTDAVAAAAAMNPSTEEERITIHIAPGTYREQIVVNTPYITLKNDTEKEVLITWYYGIGYKYYSADAKGFYNVENAFDKYEKKIASKWGTAVYVYKTATAFRAEGITFENSFNRYITDEELEDGVELSMGESIRVVRNYNTDVQSKAATERAAAIVVEADKAEFADCSFLSSQDTVYAAATGTHMYFKNCFIEGQTDYIFGEGSAVFDACELSFKGYSANSLGGYITAGRPGTADAGYLFRNCVVSGNDKLTVTPGYFGRPWGATAAVTFLNTRLESADLIAGAGWADMSGNSGANANFFEYNTTLLDGSKVDISSRIRPAMTDETADQVQVENYFGSWVPSYYVEEADQVEFAVKPFVTDNGDLNTPYPGHKLTVGYSLGTANDANDASVIQWYCVKDGVETLVKTAAAGTDKTYKIGTDDVGGNIAVVVTPVTVSGKTGAAEKYTVEAVVRDGYEDPDSNGSDVELGDGVNLFVVGDSTVKDYSAAGIWSSGKARDEGAWGEFLQSYFDKEKVTVVNYANGGRSSRNFINEGSLDLVADKIGEGDYLLIQFGHNDCANGSGYLADRYVPLGTPDENGIYPVTPGVKVTTPAELAGKGYGDTCYTYDCGGTYKWYLKQYIEVAKNAGAIPVLVTPVARMYYNADGTIKPHHDSTDATTGTQVTSGNAYVTAVKQLAEEENVLLIDGFEMTKQLFEDAYSACGKDTYGTQIMYAGDKTHNNKLGGMIEAAAVADALQNMGLNISYAVKAPARVLGETTKGQTVFSVNGNGELTAYDINSDYAERAPYWEQVGQKYFAKITEKAEELNKDPGGGDEPGDDDEPEEGLYVTLADPDAVYVYSGSAVKPAIIVKNNGKLLQEGVDYTVSYTNNVNASTAKKPAKLTVSGKGNLTGKETLEYKILPASLLETTVGAVRVTKNSKAVPVLFYNGVKLTAKDYTVEEPNRKFTEDGVLKVTGKGNFTGTVGISVEVVDKSELKKFKVTVAKGTLVYDGSSKEDAVRALLTVTDATTKKTLEEGVDYMISFSGNTTKAGAMKLSIVGIGEYTGSINKSFTIKPLAANASDMVLAGVEESYEFTPSGVTVGADLTITCTATGEVLTEGVDYKLSYANNKKISTAKASGKYTVTFLGNYKGTRKLTGTFSIVAKRLDAATEGVQVVLADQLYTKAGTYFSKPYVTIDGVALKSSDYTLSYYKDAELTEQITSKNKLTLPEQSDVATVYVKITGKGNYAVAEDAYLTDSYQVYRKSAYKDFTKVRVTVVNDQGTKLGKADYTGKALEPKVKVEIKDGKTYRTLTEGTDYTVAYVSNINKGKATIVLNGCGEYAGSKTAYFTIGAKSVLGSFLR